MNIQVKKVPIATAKDYSVNRVLFIGISGKMYIPETQKEVEDEEFSPLLQSIIIESNHTQEEIKSHWESGGELTF